MPYLLHLAFLGLLYASLGMSLNLVSGYTGLLSMCHAAFFGLGAYTTALMTLRHGWHWSEALVLGALLVVGAALSMGSLSLRFRDDDFVIVTFSFQIIFYRVAQNWASLTGGPPGLPGVPSPELLGWSVRSPLSYTLLAGIFVAMTAAILSRLVASPYGRVLRAIREDEGLALSLGKPTHVYKRSVFVIGSLIAGLAGALYAPYLTYINPDSFTVQESIFMLSIVIIGGAGQLLGSIVGAFALVLLPEMLRFLGLPNDIGASLRQILYGGLLVACMLWRPEGLMGRPVFRSQGKP